MVAHHAAPVELDVPNPTGIARTPAYQEEHGHLREERITHNTRDEALEALRRGQHPLFNFICDEAGLSQSQRNRLRRKSARSR